MPKEKIYNLGVLGKWSETTLLEQALKRCRYDPNRAIIKQPDATYSVFRIEEEYRKRKEKEENRVYRYKSKRVWFFTKMEKIHEILTEIEISRRETNKLNDAFYEYHNAMIDLAKNHGKGECI